MPLLYPRQPTFLLLIGHFSEAEPDQDDGIDWSFAAPGPPETEAIYLSQACGSDQPSLGESLRRGGVQLRSTIQTVALAWVQRWVICSPSND